MSLEGQVLQVLRAFRGSQARRALARRLEKLEMDLLQLTLDVRQLEQTILDADLHEADAYIRHHFPRPTDAAS